MPLNHSSNGGGIKRVDITTIYSALHITCASSTLSTSWASRSRVWDPLITMSGTLPRKLTSNISRWPLSLPGTLSLMDTCCNSMKCTYIGVFVALVSLNIFGEMSYLLIVEDENYTVVSSIFVLNCLNLHNYVNKQMCIIIYNLLMPSACDVEV